VLAEPPYLIKEDFMLTLAIVLFAVAAVGGATMAIIHFRGNNPQLPLAALHGVLAATALANLLLRHNDTPLHDPMIPLALSALCLTLVFAGGWFGGELVYRHGVGRTG
jgi:uncharacterized membrane protein